ncbi:FecR family protein [Verticiella alkaliphila]|uniref:FecR family protein n=1 Tax=Verticiella alkaliphila TaxID=2779529 RepID=UPI00353055ED
MREPSGVSRRRMLAWGAAIAAGGLGWATWRHTELPVRALAWTADVHTGVGEIRRMALPDGSALWLNALSAVDVDFGGTLRRLHLLAGEIQVRTRPAPGRDFVTDTRHGRLRAFGTRFTARVASAATLVAVYEGAMAITTRTGAEAIVAAGQQAWFSSEAVMPSTPAEAARDAWTRGVVIADNLPLADMARELSRYYGGHISVSAEVASLRVFGSYPAQDPVRALHMLASVMPIQVRRWLPGWLHVQRLA